ncbi:MAG: VapC toxin family PIN domain ribonuclease [Gammaproteobacteria bacterium]|nr:VapC toxin family PIN domain ribonuclease [Gammaproteobacteria bacterium]
MELLLNTALGARIAARIGNESVDLDAPHLIDVEVTQVIRRYLRAGGISEETAAIALGHWRDLDVERHAHEPYLDRIWQLRGNFSAYDASYVALAEVLGVPLLTTDSGLAGAVGSHASIELMAIAHQ